MADPRNKKKDGSSSGEQDLAALLRASLDRDASLEPEDDETKAVQEEDELSHLLREQLARFGQENDADSVLEPTMLPWQEDDAIEDDVKDMEADVEPVIDEDTEADEADVEPITDEDADAVEEDDEWILPEGNVDMEPVDELYIPEGVELMEGDDDNALSVFQENDNHLPVSEPENVGEAVAVTEIYSEKLPEQEVSLEPARPLSRLLEEIQEQTEETDSGDYDVNGRFTQDIITDFLSSSLDDDTKDALRRIYGSSEETEATWREDLTEEEPVSPVEETSPAEALPEVLQDSNLSEAAVSPTDTPLAQTHVSPAKWYDPLQLTLDSVESSKRQALGIAAKDQKEGVPQPRRSSEPTAEAQEDTQTLHGYAVADSDDTRNRDTALYLHLGYEEELSQVEDMAHITRVGNAYEKEEHLRERKDGVRNSPPVAYDGEDYESHEQTCAEERAYEGAGAMSKLRLWMTLAFALVGLAFDLFPDYAPYVGGLEALADTFMYPLMGLIWLVLGCLPSLAHIRGGLRSLWELKPVAYAIPASALLLTAIHTLTICFLPGNGIRLYVGSSLLLLFLACLGDCFKTAAEQVSFRVISSGKAKYVLTEEKGDHDTFEENPYVHTFRVRKVERLADYFRQVTRYDRREAVVGHSLSAALLGAMTVSAVVVVLGKGAWFSGLSAFMGTYLAALPVLFMMSLTLPLMLVNKTIGRHGCTVLSPEASEIFAPGKQVEPESMCLRFTAGQALKATHVKAVTLSGDSEAGKYRAIANRLFTLLDFPLEDDEFPVRDGDIKGIHVEVAEVEKDALRLYMVDDRRNLACEVLMGTYQVLRQRGIRLPRSHREDSWKKTEDSRVLYLAFDRQFRLAYTVRYRPRRSFASAMEALTPMGYVLSVISYDPLVTEDLLAPLTTAQQPRMEMFRPHEVTEERESRSCSILSTGRAIDIAYPLMACRHMKTLSRRMLGLSWLALTMALICLGCCLGLGIMTHVSSLILWFWHILWQGITWLCVKTAMRPSRLSMSDKHE